MKNFRWLCLLILLVNLSNLHAQDFDRFMKKQFDCSDISQNCSRLFEQFMNEDKTDSARSLLLYWKKKCGRREPVQRAMIIFALKTGTFHDTLFNVGMLSHIYNYQSRIAMGKSNDLYLYDYNQSYYGYIPIDQEFDHFTLRIARQMKPFYPEGTMERLMIDLYGDKSDSVFFKLQSIDYAGSRLYQEYYTQVDRWLNTPEFHLSLITGIWIPTGGISRLGVHPELGFQMGMKKKKMNYDITMCFKFGNTGQAYYARRIKVNDSLVLTRHFLGGYIGLDFGYDLYVKYGHEFQLQAGLGLDGFDVFDKTSNYYNDNASIMTYNFNLGIEHRFYFSNSFYLGLQVKYNIVDYSINRIIDFTGNPVTIRLIMGGFSNPGKQKNLEIMKYRWRK